MRYSIKQLFTYTGVSRLRIIKQLALLGLYKLCNWRYVYAPVNTYRMKLDLKTPGLSAVLFVYGSRELPDTHVAQKIITEGMQVADIGANIGYYTLLEAENVGPNGHVYAFEPDPRNISLLKENVALNKYSDRVTIYEQAVSNEAGRKRFQLGERSNVSSFVDRPDVVDSAEVECISLSDFEYIEQIDMLRMDAEGYECKIIEGVLPFLRKDTKPFKIMLEVHPNEYNDTDLNFKKNLQDLFEIGFSTSHLITSSNNVDAFKERGYQSAGHWQETKHSRELYEDVSNEDTLLFLEQRKIRSLVLARNSK